MIIAPLVTFKFLGVSTTVSPLTLTYISVLISCCAIVVSRSPLLNTRDRNLPPYAPVTLFEALTKGKEFPFFISRLVQSVGPIFRLRKTLFMDITIVNDALVVKEILNDPSSLKPRKMYQRLDKTVEGKYIPYLTTKEGDMWKKTKQSVRLNASLSSEMSTYIKKTSRGYVYACNRIYCCVLLIRGEEYCLTKKLLSYL